MTATVGTYLLEGCMRCPFGGTPECKVHRWQDELRFLRELVLECGLEEQIKWGVPCYSYQGKNILIVAAFREYAALSFFKGVLLQDSEKLLHFNGENSQSAKFFRFEKLSEISALRDLVKSYIFEMIELENAGAKVNFKTIEEFEVPEEFERKLNEDSALRAAFEALTPGRKRSYLHHFAQTKSPKTREARIEKCREKIFLGKGFNEY